MYTTRTHDMCCSGTLYKVTCKVYATSVHKVPETHGHVYCVTGHPVRTTCIYQSAERHIDFCCIAIYLTYLSLKFRRFFNKFLNLFYVFSMQFVYSSTTGFNLKQKATDSYVIFEFPILHY